MISGTTQRLTYRPFEALATVEWGWENVEPPCAMHPEKTRKTNLIEALDGLVERFRQPRSHIRRTYKCPACNGWHYTSQESRWKPLADPFPRPFWYGVIVNGRRVWVHRDPKLAQRMARKMHGVVVPYMDPVRRVTGVS